MRTAFPECVHYRRQRCAAFRGTVSVDGTKIAAVTRSPSEAPIAPGEEVIDCTGFTLLPGLTEAHCHISFNNLTSIYSAVEIQPKTIP